MNERISEARRRYRETLAALGSESEVVFLDRAVIEAIHEDLVSEFGGLHGLRDPGALESALAAPMQMCCYQEETSLAQLGAALASRIVGNHPFLDGNKRTGFMALVVFLGENGQRLSAANADALNAIKALASGTLDEAGFSRWVARHSEPNETQAPRP